MSINPSKDELSAGNDLLAEYLTSNQIFSVGRLGSVESNIIRALREENVTYRLKWQAWVNAGISYPTKSQVKFFDSVYRHSMEVLDVLAIWPNETLTSQSQIVESNLKDHAKVIPMRCLDPVQLSSEGFDPEAIWTNRLLGKNVLVVHSFAGLIKRQYSNLELLHRFQILPKFNLFVIEPPETNGLTFWRGSYERNLVKFKEKLSKFVDDNEIDIVLIAAGAYGLPLVQHLKESEISAIYMGGSLQLLFGIMGTRWRELPNIQEVITDSWIDGSNGKKPFGYRFIEGATYW
jgi:hypothetical protein